jgi:hypothetical protein
MREWMADDVSPRLDVLINLSLRRPIVRSALCLSSSLIGECTRLHDT